MLSQYNKMLHLLIDEQREKRLQACLRKHRQRIPIEEVDSSSDEEQPKKPGHPLFAGLFDLL